MRIISNPILHIFRPLPNKRELKTKLGLGEQVILIFGRIAAEKNLEVALDVFADVATRSDAKLVFIGDGPARAELQDRARKESFADRVLFLGTLRGEPLVEAINACDIVLITSTSESQSMTLLQAQACGLPAVVAQAGGLPEYVWSDVNGYVVPPKDIKMFADRLIKILEDPTLAKNLGEASHKSTASYAPEAIAKQFLEVYGSLTKDKNRA